MIRGPDDPTEGKRAPLAPSVLYILIALAAGPRNARGVSIEVRRISADAISDRTTRRLLTQMEALEVVAGFRGRPKHSAREFALTPLGITILCDETRRLKTLIERIDVTALCAPASPRALSS